MSATAKSLLKFAPNAFAASFLMPKTGVLTFLAQRNKGLASRENIAVYDLATENLGPEAQTHSRRSRLAADHLPIGRTSGTLFRCELSGSHLSA